MKRTLAVVSVGVIAFGGVFASASNLGGITGGKVGADNTAVASCDTDGITSDYTSEWDTTDKRYEVATVTIGGVLDACDGKTVKVTLTDAAGVSLGQGSLVIPASTATSFGVTMATPAATKLTDGVHVTIA